MIRYYRIFIPKDKDAAKRHLKNKAVKDDYFLYIIQEEEFDILWRHHVFDILNKKYDLLIDECEEETVTAEQLKDTYDSLFPIDGEWKKAVDHIIRLGTFGYLSF